MCPHLVDHLQKVRGRYEEPVVDSWVDVIRLMRRFVLSHYHRDLHNKLQMLIRM